MVVGLNKKCNVKIDWFCTRNPYTEVIRVSVFGASPIGYQCLVHGSPTWSPPESNLCIRNFCRVLRYDIWYIEFSSPSFQCQNAAGMILKLISRRSHFWGVSNYQIASKYGILKFYHWSHLELANFQITTIQHNVNLKTTTWSRKQKKQWCGRP